jgi:hypothetical protein
MKPVLRENGTISSFCPDCGVLSNFTIHGNPIKITKAHVFKGKDCSFIFYHFHQCAGCGRGGISKAHSGADNWTKAGSDAIEFFFPFFRDVAPLPSGVPDDIVAEFREAELCASFGATRASSALFRSVLEKTLKANGYVKQGKNLRDLQSKIDEATKDGIITEARRKRAHDEIRVLGNDVLHDDWRIVTDDEVEAAHHYTQRILEDFYDERTEVEKILTAKGRIQAQPPSPQATTSQTSSPTVT